MYIEIHLRQVCAVNVLITTEETLLLNYLIKTYYIRFITKKILAIPKSIVTWEFHVAFRFMYEWWLCINDFKMTFTL